jgi:hypothetical protein
VKLEEMRTRFGGIEEILGGGEGSVGRSDRRATLELIIAVSKAKAKKRSEDDEKPSACQRKRKTHKRK